MYETFYYNHYYSFRTESKITLYLETYKRIKMNLETIYQCDCYRTEACLGARLKLTFPLQSLGSHFLGQLHKLTVFLFSNLLIVCIQILPFLGFLLRL